MSKLNKDESMVINEAEQLYIQEKLIEEKIRGTYWNYSYAIFNKDNQYKHLVV